MLPKLENNQNVFIEITNSTHGGIGWEIGSCLWSPMFDARKARAWKIMEDINLGDVIIHLVDINGLYHWTGISVTSSSIIQNLDEPSDAGEWKGKYPYQKVNLTCFSGLKEPQPISVFFRKYGDLLKEFHHKSDFYVLYGKQKELRIAERYIAKCQKKLYNLFEDYSTEIDFNPKFEGVEDYLPTLNEPRSTDNTTPGRSMAIVSRIIRDTNLSRSVKLKYNSKCQVCGCSILLPNSHCYIEGHHLKPLGGDHAGPDIKGNIIILCPNHHAEFDYGSIAINPEDGLIEHIDVDNFFYKKELAYLRDDLDKEYLEYHYTKIFRK